MAGNYITSYTDVKLRLRRTYETLYTRDGAIDTEVVDADIEAAEAELHSYLAQRYTVPVTGGNQELLKHWALTLLEDIAYGMNIPDAIATRVAATRKRLEKVAEGDLSLGAATVPDERAAATDAIIVEGATPEFERDDLKGW